LGQLDAESKDDLAMKMVQTQSLLADFYKGLRPEDQTKANNLLTEFAATGMQWLGSTSQQD